MSDKRISCLLAAADGEPLALINEGPEKNWVRITNAVHGQSLDLPVDIMDLVARRWCIERGIAPDLTEMFKLCVLFTERYLTVYEDGYDEVDAIADVLTERGYTVTSNEHYVELARRARHTRASQSATRPTRRHRAD